MKTSNQSMYPAPSQAAHTSYPSQSASDHGRYSFQMFGKNQNNKQKSTLTEKSQRIAGNSFGAIGQNNSKGGFAHTQNTGNNSNERQMLAGGPGASKRGGMNVLVSQTTHHKMDANSQYNLQMKNQQEHQNQAIYGSKKKQADIKPHGTSLSGHSQQFQVNQKVHNQGRDDESENAFDQMSTYLFNIQSQNNAPGVKQMFVNQADKLHARVLSDDIKFNTGNLQKSTFQAGIGGTQIHTNQLSSLDATYAQNTQAYNTALGSQRDTAMQVSKSGGSKYPKKNVTSFDNHKNVQKINTSIGKNSGKARLIENKDSKSLGGTTSTHGNSQLRQTAQFGPQMNLIKSQLPNNSVKGSMTSAQQAQTQQQYHSNDTKFQRNQQQKKIQINNQKMKSTELRKNSKNTQGDGGSTDFGNYFREQYQSQGMPASSTGVDQNNIYAGVIFKNQGQAQGNSQSQQQQYDEAGGSINKRQQAMIQQSNQLKFQQNQQLLTGDKRPGKQGTTFAKSDQKGISSNKSDKTNTHQATQGPNNYSIQPQRKQKLIYNGSNLIGYDMSRTSNQTHVAQQNSINSQQNTYHQTHYGMPRNISIDRTSQKSKTTHHQIHPQQQQYGKQQMILNQIDIKNQQSSNIAQINHTKTVKSLQREFNSNSVADAPEQANQGQTQSTPVQKQSVIGKVGSDPKSMEHQQNIQGQMPRDSNHLQSHSFDFRQQHQSQMNRIGNYTVFRDGNKDEHTHSQAQHPRQASGMPGDFNAQHSQPRYSHPNQGLRSKNLANNTNKMQAVQQQQPSGMSKGNLRSFDAQMNRETQHNKLMSDGLQQPSSIITPGSSNIQTPSQIMQKNKRNVHAQQASMNQRNISSQLGSNITKAKSSSLQHKKDGQSSSNSAVRATGALHGSDQSSFNRYSGGQAGGSGKPAHLSNLHHQGKPQQPAPGMPSPFPDQTTYQTLDRGHVKMKQGGPQFALSSVDQKQQSSNGRSSFNNPGDRAASIVQGGGQPAAGGKAQGGTGPQTKSKAVINYDHQDPRYAETQNRGFSSSNFNPGGNVSMTKDNLDRISILQGHNIANAIATKSKRLNAANRGVNCGTNARVNTFDNRGMQAQQQHTSSNTQGAKPQHPFLPQMMKQQPVNPSRVQMQQMANSQGGQQAPHARIHSVNANPNSSTNPMLTNQQQFEQEQHMSRQMASGFDQREHVGGGSIVVGQVRQAVSQRPGDIKGSNAQQYQQQNNSVATKKMVHTFDQNTKNAIAAQYHPGGGAPLMDEQEYGEELNRMADNAFCE